MNNLPYSAKFERIVLGLICVYGPVAIAGCNGLTAEVFFLSSHRLIFETLSRLVREGIEEPNVAILTDALGESGVHEVGGLAEIFRLTEDLPINGDVRPYVERLFEYFRQRCVQAACEVFLQESDAPLESRLTILQSALASLPSKNGHAAQGYSLVHIGDLLQRPDVPVDYVWEGRLVAGTLSLCVAKPKVGKGTMARNLALAVSQGELFLGAATEKGEVVYLALEEREEDVRADFKAMGATGLEPLWIHAAPTPEAAVPELIQLIQQRRPVLVVIDPLIRLAKVRDEKAYAETYNALGPLIDVARECGAHILLLHHSSKMPKTDAVDAPLGSTAFGGIPATLLYLVRNSEGVRTIQTVQRIGDDLPETVLLFDKDSKHLTLGRAKREADRAEAESRIAAFLKEVKAPQTQADIRDGVEGRTKAVRAGITALVAEAKIQRSGSGKKGDPFVYQFPHSGSQPISGTGEPDSKNALETRANTEEKVVPEKTEKTILVPDNERGLFDQVDCLAEGPKRSVKELLQSDITKEEATPRGGASGGIGAPPPPTAPDDF